ncbi:hypothetical protein SAMN02745165_02858 [Malonomonas rubra DSM 5091]|uniref:Uncharacterized protein n=1 Tax=Malonomonas rubra DSM 5091 TaxID=1122189 RepID=A0A1M6L3U7_MALRU|nr:hypothetical protein [Malonomonas rubra]SHJ65866.1 hypothetical protein SAMN02745165_02858 [Malonomonas rubra DSM 5091]
MKHSLSQPSAALSARLVSQVSFKERFPAGRLKPPVGLMPGNVRSLSDLHLLLAPDDASLPGINLTALPAWIESSFGDNELAEAIRAAADAAPNYAESCLAVYDVVGWRLEQARMFQKEAEV